MKNTEPTKETPDDGGWIGKKVRFVYPGHRYHNQIGTITAGNPECCLLYFEAIKREFGPCGPRNGEKLEPVLTGCD